MWEWYRSSHRTAARWQKQMSPFPQMSNYSFKALQVSVSASGQSGDGRETDSLTVWTVIMGDNECQTGQIEVQSVRTSAPRSLLQLQPASSFPPNTHTHTLMSWIPSLFFCLKLQPLYHFSNWRSSLREEARGQPMLRPPTVCLKMCVRVSERQPSDNKSRVTLTSCQRGCGLRYCFARLENLILVMCYVPFRCHMKN